MTINVLLVGAGGREHALAWKLAQSPQLGRLLIAPGNPGTAQSGQNVPVSADAHSLLLEVAQRAQVGLVVIGPEAPLAAGLADACLAVGLPVFGPTAAAARIESSKAFAKQIMQRAGVPTAEAHVFDSPTEALAFVQAHPAPWVVKADGLAAGKGVVVPDDAEASMAAIAQVATLGAGQRILLEQRLAGPEVSLIALCDGERLLALPPACDHKRLRDGDAGPNTGGMGAFAPAPQLSRAAVDQIVEQAMLPVVRALAADGTPFRGALYAGLMLTPDGPKVLEFNARFGDPETQVLMPLLRGDLLATLLACAEGRLQPDMLAWQDGAAACVILAAHGYPEAPRRGDPIDGTTALDQPGVLLFHAGTTRQDGQLLTAGGRVLAVTGTGPTLRVALERAYASVELISFDGMQYRQDIGRRLVE